jgi:hypothetical protein
MGILVVYMGIKVMDGGKSMREMVQEEISHIRRGNATQNELRMFYWPMRMNSLGKKATAPKTKSQVLIESMHEVKKNNPDFVPIYDKDYFTVISLNVGPYILRLDGEKYEAENDNGVVVVKIKDHPEIDVRIFVSKLPSDTNRDMLWRDTINNDITGALKRMMDIGTTSMAALSDIEPQILIDSHPGFYVFTIGGNDKSMAYRIGYWIEGEYVINIFATFPSAEDRTVINTLMGDSRVTKT